jgi:hypothetical protein
MNAIHCYFYRSLTLTPPLCPSVVQDIVQKWELECEDYLDLHKKRTVEVPPVESQV